MRHITPMSSLRGFRLTIPNCCMSLCWKLSTHISLGCNLWAVAIFGVAVRDCGQVVSGERKYIFILHIKSRSWSLSKFTPPSAMQRIPGSCSERRLGCRGARQGQIPSCGWRAWSSGSLNKEHKSMNFIFYSWTRTSPSREISKCLQPI